jgi:hypothetical protein
MVLHFVHIVAQLVHVVDAYTYVVECCQPVSVLKCFDSVHEQVATTRLSRQWSVQLYLKLLSVTHKQCCVMQTTDGALCW